ncbi:MAG: hypothetical protein RLZZ303_1100 [Candidatus Hydrogenedentota bacterium]
MPRLLLSLGLLLAAVPSGASDFLLLEEVAAKPGQVIVVPPGVHEIAAPIHLTTDGAGLSGSGVIVQTDPAQPIVRVEGARGVTIEGVTLTRPAGQPPATESALRADQARGLQVRSVRVVDNQSQAAAIRLSGCENTSITGCEIVNYKAIGIDDRTTSPLYGYAFHCIDGAGIGVDNSVHTLIADNRVIEDRYIPAPELKESHRLGQLTDGNQPLNPGELARGVAKRGYVDNWHQGSAIVVTGPEHSRHTIIRGNLIVNAAQAVDLHCDYAVVADNLIDRCMIGVKATHGSYGVSVTGNTISGADLWGMVFNPGAASHGGEAAKDGTAERAWNGDAGLVISGNIIADYGHGNEYWNWGGREPDAPSSYAIAFFKGQLDSNPPYRDIVLSGNLVLSGGRALSPGTPPRYRYAVYFEGWHESGRRHETAAIDFEASGNRLHPGLLGVSNIPLQDE